MSSTNVHSKNNLKTSVAGIIFKATERTLEVPPRGQVFEIITSYVESQGNIEIATGEAKLYENGTLQLQDGNLLEMKNSNAYHDLTEKKLKAEKLNKETAKSR